MNTAHTQASPFPVLLAALRDRLAAYCGVYLDDTRAAALRTAAQQRAQSTGCGLAEYLRATQGAPHEDELQRLAELLLNHETQFCRNRQQLRALETVVLPELHRRLPPGAPLRLWSAGCATGEEPYSLAMAAYSALGVPLPRPVEILATDLSAPALARAREGVYSGRSLANLTEHQRERFFTPCGAALRVNDALRRLVRFEQRNLLAPFPPAVAGTHIILCQNVTIYFQLSSCRSLVERFHAALADGGMLLLGFSETLWQISDRFRWREIGGSYLYEKAAAAAEPSRPLRRTGATAHELADRGRALLDAGQVETALELIAATPLAGSGAPALMALAARAHADRGELDLAAAEAGRALELNPLTTEAHLLIGLIYARQGRHESAISQLERARSLDHTSPVIAFHLAECYRQTGRDARALREYRQLLRRLADHPPEQLFDGVAAGWLGATCRHYERILSREQ